MSAPEPVTVIVVTEAPAGDQPARERHYDADSWAIGTETGAIDIERTSRKDDPTVAHYAPGAWLSVREHGATTGDPYYQQGRKLAIALDALRSIAAITEPDDGTPPDTAARALERIAEVDL